MNGTSVIATRGRSLAEAVAHEVAESLVPEFQRALTRHVTNAYANASPASVFRLGTLADKLAEGHRQAGLYLRRAAERAHRVDFVDVPRAAHRICRENEEQQLRGSLRAPPDFRPPESLSAAGLFEVRSPAAHLSSTPFKDMVGESAAALAGYAEALVRDGSLGFVPYLDAAQRPGAITFIRRVTTVSDKFEEPSGFWQQERVRTCTRQTTEHVHHLKGARVTALGDPTSPPLPRFVQNLVREAPPLLVPSLHVISGPLVGEEELYVSDQPATSEKCTAWRRLERKDLETFTLGVAAAFGIAAVFCFALLSGDPGLTIGARGRLILAGWNERDFLREQQERRARMWRTARKVGVGVGIAAGLHFLLGPAGSIRVGSRLLASVLH